MGWLARRQAMIEQAAHPRDCGPDSFKPALALLRVGHFIDWLDGRPDDREADCRTMRWLAGNPVVGIAGALTGRLPSGRVGGEPTTVVLSFAQWDHRQEYAPVYHDRIVAHLASDELPGGRATYTRLLDLQPECISALANVAEFERRAGEPWHAEQLLRRALLLSGQDGVRHGVFDRSWRIPIRCALARIGCENGNRARDVLSALGSNELAVVAERLERMRRECYDCHVREDGERRAEDLRVSLDAAFFEAGREQRIVLAAAMRMAGIFPGPPPAAHDTFEDAAEAYRRVFPGSGRGP